MGTIFHYLNRGFIVLVKLILTPIPKDKNLILLGAWFGQKYGDSSMYQYEYLMENTNYKAVWYTRNKEIYSELEGMGKPVVYSKSLKAIWYQIRAIMLITSVQTDDFCPYFYRNCICVDLDHGFALKQVGYKIPNIGERYVSFRNLLRWGMDYWMTTPTDFCMHIVEDCYAMTSDHIIRCNKPRTDALFDPSLQIGKNGVVEKIKNGRKAIVWMPTHRSCGKVNMNVEELLDLKSIQEICEKKNCIFIIKKHFYHNTEKSNLEQYPNIYDITTESVDSQVILAQADALISDYSASYIEYLILDRPILLYAFDKEDYLKKERGLYIPLEKNTAGELVETKEGLLRSIDRVTNDWYDNEYAGGRRKAKDLYFNTDVAPGKYREYFKEIMDQLISGTYKPKWK